MHKKLLSISLAILINLILFSFPIFAQETTDTKSEAIELNIDAIYQPCEDPADSLCVTYPTNVANHPDPVHIDHEFGLSAEELPANTDVYIVGCIDTADGARCTTGNTNLDNLLNNIPGGDQMNADPTHELKVLENPKKTDAGGKLNSVIVRSYTAQSTSHFFNGYYITKTGANPTSAVTPIANNNDLTVKQTSIEFQIATPSPIVRPKIKFRALNNDPKGRFFDSQSLEPIPEGEVSLLNNLKKLFVYQKLENPQKVKINGEFNFWVPNGLYYLDITKKPINHSWPITINKVNNNYSKAYYCDPEIKDEKNQTVPLYLQQYSITEFNKLVHCDIPFDPGTNTPYRSEVKTVSYSSYRTNSNTATSFTGRVTHPLTIITLKGELTAKVVATTIADKLGSWKIIVNSSSYPLKPDGSPDRLIAVYNKVDLTTNMQSSTVVNGLTLEPILTYIEGFAYDQTGKLLPLAKVGYHQLGTEKNVYITTSDSKGFFRIPTRYLPSFGYELIFVPSGSVAPVVFTTSQFAQKNNEYLKTNNLNLLTKVNKDLLNINKAQSLNEDINTTNGGKNTNQNNTSGTNSGNKISSQMIIVIAVVLILLMILAVVVIIIFMRKPKQQILQ